MKIGVIGGGAWGTALAQIAAQHGEPVYLWARERDVVHCINVEHENRPYLAGVPLSPSIRATEKLNDLDNCDALLAVVPAQHLRAVLSKLPSLMCPLLLCTKGIEAESHALMSDVAADVHSGATIAVLSGPTFAAEVATGLPTAVTLACNDANVARTLAQRLGRKQFRIYPSNDVTGAEIGGAVKNVLAIACGVAEGAGLGQSARAALIARGFAEMTRYGSARGGRAETLAGLSGLGDLVLTCSSTKSRNFSVGVGLGQGKKAVDLISDRATVAEGVFTAPVLRESAYKLGVEMPVAEAVCLLLDGHATINDVMTALLGRPHKAEA